MATKTYFLLIPEDRTSPTEFKTLPTRAWRQNTMTIGPMLGCTYVERVKVPLGSGGLLRYIWVDEEGHVYAKPINQRASKVLYPGLLAGPVAVELGAFDLASHEDAAKWDRLMARIGPDLRAVGIAIPDQVPA